MRPMMCSGRYLRRLPKRIRVGIPCAKLVKRVDDTPSSASIEKKMRDAKKSKKMSEADKAERIASLQRDAEAEMERLAKEREAVAKEDCRGRYREAQAHRGEARCKESKAGRHQAAAEGNYRAAC